MVKVEMSRTQKLIISRVTTHELPCRDLFGPHLWTAWVSLFDKSDKTVTMQSRDLVSPGACLACCVRNAWSHHRTGSTITSSDARIDFWPLYFSLRESYITKEWTGGTQSGGVGLAQGWSILQEPAFPVQWFTASVLSVSPLQWKDLLASFFCSIHIRSTDPGSGLPVLGQWFQVDRGLPLD